MNPLVSVAVLSLALSLAQPGGRSELLAAAAPAQKPPPPAQAQPPRPQPPRSRALGQPWQGRLLHGVRLEVEGPNHFTWDPVRKRVPNRSWRRWGTDRLVATIDDVLARYRAANPDAPRVAVGDLSRTRGGDFGPRFGSLGHASHQNGLDVDVYYPRLDRREWAPRRVDQVDLELAQELVDLFVAAGAEKVFVGPATGLRGPRGVVQKLVHHDDHLHIRIRPSSGRR